LKKEKASTTKAKKEMRNEDSYLVERRNKENWYLE
jgi:hypothetical protein